MLKIIVASDTLLEKDNKFLLVQESKGKARRKWNFPGGKIELEEDVISCAKREVEEEIGIKTKPKYLIGIYQIWPKPKENIVVFVFKSDILEGRFNCSEEIMNLKWFSIEEIEELNEEGLLRDRFVLTATKDYLKGNKLSLEFIKIQD